VSGVLGFEGEDARQKVAVLLTMCFALAMAMLDNTVVNVALPSISRDLGASVSDLQWIVDGYVLAFASLLLTGGTTGDRYGRRRMFLVGLAVFTASSLLCGLSQSTAQLIAARGLQGAAAAVLMPGTLAIITVTFPPHERAKAIGLWAGVSGLALALGPTVGGLMVDHLGWQSVFFLNVPVGAVAFLIASRTVRESRSEVARRLDVPGLVLGSSALLCLTYALIEANVRGWSDPLIVGAFALAAGLLAAFLGWELRAPSPMIPLRFFRIPAFSAGNLVAFSVSLGMFASFFFLSLYLQLIRGYSAFEAGLRFLPMTAMIILTAPNAGRFASRHGSRMPMTYGLLLAGTGLLVLSRLDLGTSYLVMLPVFMLMGHGMGATMSPMTAAVMNAVGHERAGLGSAMTNTSREVGGVFGIALLGTLLTHRLASTLAPALAGLGLPSGTSASIEASARTGRLDPTALAGLTPEQGAAVAQAYRQAFLSGFRLSLALGGAVLLVAAAVANRFVPGGAPPRPEVEAVSEPSDVGLG